MQGFFYIFESQTNNKMGIEQKEYDDSLNDSLLQSAMTVNTKADVVFNVQSCFDENGKFIYPKGVKTAYLIYIQESRKLQKFDFPSTMSENGKHVYGAYKNEAKTELKRFSIVSVTTLLNLETPLGKAMFAAACASRFTVGAKDAYPNPYFKIEIPELRAELELAELDNAEEALTYVSKLNEEELYDLALLLGITGLSSKTLSEKKTFMRKMALNTPEKIITAKNDQDKAIILIVKKAIGQKIIKEQKGVFLFSDYQMGITIEQTVHFCKQNEEIFELIKSSLTKK